MTIDELEQTEMHTRAVALAAPQVQGDGRTVEVQLVRWNEPARVSDDGRTFYSEEFARGGLRVMPGARVLVRNEHNPDDFPATAASGAAGAAPTSAGVVVGQLTATHVRADGLYGTIRLVDNEDGARLRGLIDPSEPIIDSLSIEFDDVYRHVRNGDRVVRSDARLTGLVFTLNPQRGDARVLAVRSTTQETTVMDESPAPEVPTAPSDDTTAPLSAPSAPVVAVARTVARPGAPVAGSNHELLEASQTLAQFSTFGEYVRARALTRSDDDREHLARSLAVVTEHQLGRRRFARAFDEAVISDVAGLVPTAWSSEVIDIYMTLAPTVANWSTGPLPDSGMDIKAPLIGTRPEVAAQANEFAEPASTKATVTTATWSVLTYSGGQEMSVQVLHRTDPSYLELLMRLYVKEMARARNAAAATVLLAHADDVNTTGLEYVDGETFPDLLIDSCGTFLATIGHAPEVVAMSIPLWKAIGKAKDGDERYMFPQFGPMNTVGTFDATTPSGVIRNIQFYVEPAWGTTDIKGVVGVRDAFRTYTGAIQTVGADVPATLSRDVAVFQFAAHGKADAAGLQLIHNNT